MIPNPNVRVYPDGPRLTDLLLSADDSAAPGVQENLEAIGVPAAWAMGVTGEGTVVAVISDGPVNFHTFGRFFRDRLDTPNALYFDGNISRLYAPELRRNDLGLPMGPILGAVVPAD